MTVLRSPTRATAQDVAKLAGVSPSAVSRVFTPGASASARTAEKVRAAAAKLGYRPNILARSLITGRTRIIGLAVATLDNHIYPIMLEQMSRALQAVGYQLLVIMAPNDDAAIEGQVQELIDYQVDGLITASVAMSNALTRACEARGLPVVMFNRGQDDTRLSQVTSDNYAGGQLAAQALLASGARRIGHISGWAGSSTGRDRANGFLAALAAAGVQPAFVADGHYSREIAQEIVRREFTGPTPPDGLFVGSDAMAFGALAVLRSELGLRVPQDVAVVGFDDVPMAAWPEFDLTSVAQPLRAMVTACIDTLLSKIEDGPAAAQARKTNLPCRLVARGSTRLPEGWTP